MALVRCYECSATISDKANCCPHCGAPIAKVGVALNETRYNAQSNTFSTPTVVKKSKKGMYYFWLAFFTTLCIAVFILAFILESGRGGQGKNQSTHSHDNCMFIGYADPNYPLNGQSHVVLEPQYGYEPVYVYRDDIYNSYHFH